MAMIMIIGDSAGLAAATAAALHAGGHDAVAIADEKPTTPVYEMNFAVLKPTGINGSSGPRDNDRAYLKRKKGRG